MSLRHFVRASIFGVILFLLTACSSVETPQVSPTATHAEQVAAPATTVPEAALPYPVPADQEQLEAAAGEQVYPAPQTPVLEPVVAPIEVTYFTPAQQEGPYYPVEKPADRDNDLVNLAGASGLPAGEVLEFNGKVYDANGWPVEGLVIEIWQTDSSGVYLHPNDPSTGQRDPNFQFYGEAVTAVDGSYSFRTILPGQYEPRPRHIHVKVKLDGQELLTTQFYFSGEINLTGDDAALLIDAEPAVDSAGNPILSGTRDIILNADLVSS